MDFSKIKNVDEFKSSVTKRQKMFDELQKLNKKHDNRKEVVKTLYPIGKNKKQEPTQHFTAKFHFYQRVSEPSKTATLAERMNNMRQEYPNYPLLQDHKGNIYTRRHLARLNVTDPRIYHFAQKLSGRTYDYEKSECSEIWNMVKGDKNAPRRDDTYVN